MKKLPAATRIAIAACCCCAPAAFAQNNNHVAWADQLVAGITPANNNWGASPAVVTWPVHGAGTYTNNSKAASFITALLNKANSTWTNATFNA